MKRLVMGLVGILFSGLALAAGPNAVGKGIEASMLVTGFVEVNPDGSVRSYTLDKQEKLPPAITSLAQRAVPEWHFKPVLVDGNPVVARARMNLRFVASPKGDGDYSVRIAGAYFGDEKQLPGEQIVAKEQLPPRYPGAAVEAKITGTVYLLVRVGRDGRVADVSAEQVNLRASGSDFDLKRWRNLLAGASTSAASKWTFTPPVSGPHAKDEFWIVSMPIDFELREFGNARLDDYGQWEVYVPGPKQPIPWMEKYRHAEDDKASAPDALPYGSISLVGSGLTLTTPLDHS
jgi:hypothetical protein